ncbi:hypothetical protein QM312_17550, partial [Burkholderia cenocepacia]|uniref:hypothetical protein n=1 Tax=Burkholderia cenocepacia TaxID=95486 RepID=UPI0024B85016
MNKHDSRRDAPVRRHAASPVGRTSALAAKTRPRPDRLPIISILSLFIFHAMPKAAFFARETLIN